MTTRSRVPTATKGRVFDIERFAVHDGPGVRTTVFLKGCPLRCAWCHNPEGQEQEAQLSFVAAKCIGCGRCVQTCQAGVHRMEAEQHTLHRQNCVACGRCAAECYTGALRLAGSDMTADEVLDEVLLDLPFYGSSGGLTISGGEPLMQAAFTHALLSGAKDEGLHCCLDTCGLAPFESIELVRPFVDLFLFDIKDTSANKHREFTGKSNDLILANLRRLHDTGAKIRLRLPLVPGLNDRPDHLDGIARLARDLPDLDGLEIMPYHRLGTSKREQFGLTGESLHDLAPASDELLNEWIGNLKDLGAHVINERPLIDQPKVRS